MFETDIDKCLCEGDPFALAAGQSASDLMEMMDIELAEDLFDFGVKIPGIQFVEPDDGVGDLIDVLLVAGRLIVPDGVDDGMVMVENIVQDGFILYKDGFLLEQGYCNVLVDPYSAGFGRFLTGKDPQKSRFSAAVAGNQCDLIAFFNMKCNVLEKWLYAIGFA